MVNLLLNVSFGILILMPDRREYDLTYVQTTGNNMWYDYSCNVRNAYEAIKLAEKIQLQPEVEWAHVNCSGTAWVD